MSALYSLNQTKLKIPFEKCMPNFNYTCVPMGDSQIIKRFVGEDNAKADWWSPNMIFYNWK